MTKQTKQVELAEPIGNQFSFKISPTMAAILKSQGEAEFELDGKIYKLFSEDKYEQAQQETVEREREEFIERLRNAMDEYNSLPENAMQFAFYLKVQDVGRFFKALQKEQE